MKHYRLLILGLILTSSINAQSLTEKIAMNACEQLNAVESYEALTDSIQPSITAAMAKVSNGASEDEKKRLGTVTGIRGIYKEVFELLPSYCDHIRGLIIENQKSQFYKLSDIPAANKHFEKGNRLMEADKYTNAIKEFKAAIQLDENFVYAIDHLAIVYRRMNAYETAIEYYKKSLEIFPEGDVALLNIAVSYSLSNDFTNAIKSYEQLKYLYVDSPEGYFGLAKMLFLTEDYENALDNLFTAHRMYVESNSDYVADSKKLMDIMFAKLTELNQEDLIYTIAKKHNMTIED